MTTIKNITVRGRYAARFAAVQALYQIEQEPMDSLLVIQQFIGYRFLNKDAVQYIKPDTNLFRQIVSETLENQEKIDELVTKVLSEDWKLNRIDSVVRAILRAATYELLGKTSVPAPVVLNEYVNLTKEYFTNKEVSFVNGALDSLSKSLNRADLNE